MIENQPLGRREIGISLLLLITLALLVRLPLISQAPTMDELYHLFAAKSWLADGELTIADGVYTRASGYTKLVALAFDLFGDHIEVLRMIGVLASLVTLITLFLWIGSTVGLIAAWIGALFYCFWPDGISVAITHRFYAAHGMLFFLGAIGIYLLVEKWAFWSRSALLGLGLAVALLLPLALMLQQTTLLGLAGIGLWILLVIGRPWFFTLNSVQRWIALGAAAVSGVAALALMATSGIGAGLLDAFRWTPEWAAASRNQFWYYHALLLIYYPTLWSMTGIAALIAMAHRPRLIGFCLTVFMPAFILQSIGGMKHLRYLYYVMPFLFVIWAVALAFLIERFWPVLKNAADGTLDVLAPKLPRKPLRAGLLGAALLFTLFANGASIKTLAMLSGITIPPMTKAPSWDVASDALEPWADDAVLLTTSEMETLYAFDRYDILISNSRMSELKRNSEGLLDDDDIGEFSVDWRTGRPVISEPESIELIMSCFKKGLIVSNVYRWRFGPQLDDDVADFIEARGIKLDVPKSSMITAYRWENDAAGGSPACADLAASYPAPSLSASPPRLSPEALTTLEAEASR